MGAVHEGVHERTGERHAVKLLVVPAGRHPEDLARFRREAALTARLEHPHIVRVHDLGLERPPYYLAMDLVEGGSLQSRLDREGPLPLALAVDVACKLTGALWHAHAHGVVHRDVKPLNILLDPQGEPRLVDFGLARDGGAVLERLTLTGEIVGTPRYIAPEQVLDSRAVDGRADVYALGGVLFAMLSGQPPMPGRDVTEVFRAVRDHVPPPPSSLRPGVPPALDAICARALAKDPAQRFASAAALLEALEAARAALVASAPGPTGHTDGPSAGAAPARRGATIALWLTALLAASVGAVALLAAPSRPSGPSTPRTTATPTPPADTAPAPPTGALTLDADADDDRPVRSPWTLAALDGRHHALSLALRDDADRIVASATLLLASRVDQVAGDRATVALMIERVSAWDGREVRRLDAGSAARSGALSGLLGRGVVCALAVSNGDVVEVRGDEALAAAARLAAGEGALGPVLGALLRPERLEALLRAAARDAGEAGARRTPIDGWFTAVGASRQALTLALEPVQVGGAGAAVADLLPGRLQDAASLWLLNGLPPLDGVAPAGSSLVPGPASFGAPPELVVVVAEALPVFAAPWGQVVATLGGGQVVGAHERRGVWRRVCVEGAAAWVVEGEALASTPSGVEGVVVEAPDAYAYPNPERRKGTALGIAPQGAVFLVHGRTPGVGRGPHLELSYGGVRCWVLERDTRPLP